MWGIIIGLLIIGAALIVLETFVPGMVVGLLGAAALVTAAILAYVQYGSAAASVVLLLLIVGGAALLAWWLRYAPRSFLARKWSLHASVPDGPDPTALNDLLHASGQTVTALRPAGVADFAGRRTDVVTRGEMVGPGQAVEVIAVEGRRVVVRQPPRYDGAV